MFNELQVAAHVANVQRTRRESADAHRQRRFALGRRRVLGHR